MVFDYKTGDSGAHPSSARGRDGKWKDLQLPLYRHLMGSLHTAEGAPLALPAVGLTLELAYLPISKDSGPLVPAVAEWDPADLASAEEAARDVIRKLRDAGGISFDPVESGRRARGEMASLLGRGLLQAEGGDG